MSKWNNSPLAWAFVTAVVGYLMINQGYFEEFVVIAFAFVLGIVGSQQHKG